MTCREPATTHAGKQNLLVIWGWWLKLYLKKTYIWKVGLLSLMELMWASFRFNTFWKIVLDCLKIMFVWYNWQTTGLTYLLYIIAMTWSETGLGEFGSFLHLFVFMRYCQSSLVIVPLENTPETCTEIENLLPVISVYNKQWCVTSGKQCVERGGMVCADYSHSNSQTEQNLNGKNCQDSKGTRGA